MDDLPIDDRRVIPARELSVGYARSGGPGGQNVNKVETKVELRWRPATSEALGEADRAWVAKRLASRLTKDGELIVTSSRTRERGRNLEDARDRLAAIVRTALERPKPRRKTRPTRAARERRLGEKKARGATKKDRGWRAPED